MVVDRRYPADAFFRVSSLPVMAQTPVLTQHNNNARTGAYTTENSYANKCQSGQFQARYSPILSMTAFMRSLCSWRRNFSVLIANQCEYN
jgi:hypothetical protein